MSGLIAPPAHVVGPACLRVEAERAHGQLVLVGGESGIGKTFLA
ncbi:MAG: hypothetical protein ABSC94_06155 [Polyangiaceae bacterium]|jgi:MoxR-like ATPase